MIVSWRILFQNTGAHSCMYYTQTSDGEPPLHHTRYMKIPILLNFCSY